MATSDNKRLPALTLAALGVVYGDIGTSPLYTMKEVFAGAHHPVPITPDNILGILSLIFWSLMLVVTLKYAAFIMRADNRGEGGIMALIALVQRHTRNPGQARALMLLGLFGTALFYGDGIITPAISVLSAVEGLEVATPAFKDWIIPITLGVLLALLAVQRHGTGRVGGLFGPITTIWFLALAALGVGNILQAPQVLAALSPLHALAFFQAQPGLAFLALGAVFLAVTGAETLYADMGHFGTRPVRLAWLGLVLPALTLNYFGQGALLLTQPEAIAHPFYHMAPDWALYPMVALATAATVIASQAVISGVYSITNQAVQLGYAPRMLVQHTSSLERGQIYLPGINWALFLAVVALVLGFGSSTNLAAAYGISVSGTMIITTLLVYVVARRAWGWSRPAAGAILLAFMAMDLAFFGANLSKIVDGGWFPLAFGAGVFILMSTWKRGRDLLKERRDQGGLPLSGFVESMAGSSLPSIAGTAVFLTPNPGQVPHALLHSLKHYKSLHERVVILNVQFSDVPYVAMADRVTVTHLGDRFYRAEVRFGFMDRPDLSETLQTCAGVKLSCDLADTTFFLGRETLIARPERDMALWRQKLFIAQSRNAGSPAAYFNLPPNRVVELGTQVEL
ncbi:MAG: potassium transporter Kup [Hydrogenophilaceae bacterium]|nr:potassium transporter Kup [Hydrogenophilaceae bacterium]